MTTVATRVRPTPDEVLAIVAEALAVVCEQPMSSLSRATDLDTVGADSLARVELAELVEARLAAHSPRLHITDADLESFRTLGDAVDYVLARL